MDRRPLRLIAAGTGLVVLLVGAFVFLVQPMDHGPTSPPHVVTRAEPDRGPAPLTVRFSAPPMQHGGQAHGGAQPTAYAWDFGDGNTSAEASPTHTYARPGVYEAVVAVTWDDGSKTRDSTTVVVTEPEGGGGGSA